MDNYDPDTKIAKAKIYRYKKTQIKNVRRNRRKRKEKSRGYQKIPHRNIRTEFRKAQYLRL